MKQMIAMSALVVLGLAAMAGAAHAGAGENILPFLKVGAGTDAVGMGYAYSSQVTDATATYWNPAGLARTSGTDILVMHNEFIADLRLEYAAVARTLGRHGVGLSFNGLFTSDLEGRDVDGSFTGNFGYSDLAFSLAYAFDFNGLFSGGLGRFADHFTSGFSVKYLREYIGDPMATRSDHIAQGLAFDFGAQYHTDRLAVGGGVKNLGGDMAFDEQIAVSLSGDQTVIGGEFFALPLIMQGGATYRPGLELMDGDVAVALEARKVRGEDLNVLFGVRYDYRNVGSLSVGYRSGLDTEDLSFGLKLNKDRLRFGYAFVPYSDDLGNSHRVSLGYHIP